MQAVGRRRLRHCICLVATFFATAGILLHPGALEAEEAAFCDRGPPNELCSRLPYDIPRFFASFVYRFLTEGAEDPFDTFSWQSFVALNWPADAAGRPLDQPIGTAPDQPRRWQFSEPSRIVLENTEASTICREADNAEAPYPLLTSQFRQAAGGVLIDADLNFVVHDTRLNPWAARRVAEGVTDTPAATPVRFADGYYMDRDRRRGGAPGSIVLKTAWRVLDPAKGDEALYLTIPGRFAVRAADSADGRARCHDLTLGLVGMHIMRKVRSGNGSDWIWSTFEHVDNAPLAANARNPNSIVTFDPFPTGCHEPNAGTRPYTFFAPDCPDCPPNRIADANWKWAPAPPFARAYAQGGRFGTQVVRCWQLFQGTEKLNKIWRAKLAGTVLANYQLIGTQWRGNHGGPLAGFGEVPRYLTNTTLETYIQDAPEGSCMGCHSTARTAAGEKSDFSFLLAE